MKKISPKKANQLKEIIYINDLKEASKQTQKSMFRSVLEPILNASSEGIVLIRCFDTQNLTGLIQRLQFSNIKVYSFSDNLNENSFDNVQKEDIWEDTEFIMVLAHRYSAMLIWDYTLSDKKDFCNLSLMLNSRKITDVCKLVAQNSLIDFSNLMDDFQPDRRGNETMNEALGKIVDYASESNEEALLKQVENEALENNLELFHRYEMISKKIRLVSHEIKNNLSVIDLYSKVIQKRIENPTEETTGSVLKAIECINRSTNFINTFLFEMKNFQSTKIEEVALDDIIQNTIELASLKAKDKNVTLNIINSNKEFILADKVKLSNVILNLIYNSIEAMDNNKQDRIVELKTEIKDDFVSIQIKDNGSGIKQEYQNSIFNLEFTTKENGNGIGLYISKESMKEQMGDLNLISSDENGTIFEILVPLKK